MDKNLVNIDDLFRQRLSGGEEEERAGAWGNMRNLLDEQMPVRPVGGINWRRMMTYTAALLLLASATFGGYEAISSHRATTAGNTDLAATGIPHTGNAATSSAFATGNHTAPASNTSNTAPAVATATSKSHHATPATTVTNTNPATGSFTVSATPATHKAINHVPVKASTTHHSATAVPATNAVASTPVVKHTHTTPATALNTLSASTTTVGKPTPSIKTTNNTTALATTAAKKHHAAHTPLVASISAKTQNGKTPVANSRPILSSGAMATASARQLQSISNNGVLAEKQTVDKVEVVQRNVTKPGDRNGHYVNDTVDKGIVSMNTYTQTPEQNTGIMHNTVATTTTGATAQTATTATAVQGSSTGKNILLASAAKSTATSSMQEAEAVTQHKHKSTGTLSNFAAMMLDFRTNLGNAKFAAGITGGINATFFAPNGISGFQLGITSEFILNQKWSILAQLKYFSRFSGNSTITDNYVTYSALPNNTYQKDSVNQIFKYNNLQSLELPFAVQYTTGKLGIYGGGNLVYNFNLYNDFQTNALSQEITNQPAKSITPQYTSGDFSSRFGVGYLFGVNYLLAPQFKADLRMSQTVWDNSSTVGSQLLSSNLYKHPSIQLSIAYTFKRQESKMP